MPPWRSYPTHRSVQLVPWKSDAPLLGWCLLPLGPPWSSPSTWIEPGGRLPWLTASGPWTYPLLLLPAPAEPPPRGRDVMAPAKASLEGFESTSWELPWAPCERARRAYDDVRVRGDFLRTRAPPHSPNFANKEIAHVSNPASLKDWAPPQFAWHVPPNFRGHRVSHG